MERKFYADEKSISVASVLFRHYTILSVQIGSPHTILLSPHSSANAWRGERDIQQTMERKKESHGKSHRATTSKDVQEELTRPHIISSL